MFKFKSKIYQSTIGKGGAYVIVPIDIKQEYNKGRLKVKATFDGFEYVGSIVNMGLKDQNNKICYILGIRKDIRKNINKDIGDNVNVTIEPLL